MDELLAKKALLETKIVLDSLGIDYWLNFGGLLGAVRDGRFIPYDNDIELNAWKHKVTEEDMIEISKELCKRGFNIYYSTLTDYISIRRYNIPIAFSAYKLEGDKAVRPHEPVEHHDLKTTISRIPYNLSEIFARNRVGKINRESIFGFRRIIIFFCVSLTALLPKDLRRKIAIMLRGISMKLNGGYGKTSFPARFYLELEDLEFYGTKFKVPGPVEEYLEFVYGPDWRIPIKDWDFHDEENKSITSIEFISEAWDYR